MRTEDEVRDAAKVILGFDDKEQDVIQGAGQIKTFNQLGFPHISDRPDGWYLPVDTSKVAIILETKSEGEDVFKTKWVEELKKNVLIAAKKYSRVIGIIYNGIDVNAYKYTSKNKSWESVSSPSLQHKSFYLSMFNQNKIDKQKIYSLTKKINDCLHFQFYIKNLYHRMIMTACALVAKRYGAILVENMDLATITASIKNTLEKAIDDDRKKNYKLNYLIEVFSGIEMNCKDNQQAINNFIFWVDEISQNINSDYWNGEDVMGIFFNEFNRYKKKSESGQIFTPDHITSFMYRLIDVNMKDRVLDATCGSGAFLVKAMCNMIKEAGGVNTKEAIDIKTEQLYGIEVDKQIFALACANMLIHKDGKTNLEQMDARSDAASAWIKQKEITKVLMNPPYERKYGCMKIVQNVMDSVPDRTICAFILPDKKLEKDGTDKRYGNKVLKKHTLKKIIKLPENLFFGVGVKTSIFVFETGRPQNGQSIIGYYIEDDGLETVKNQGRQDIRNRWTDIENYWIKTIHDGVDDNNHTRQIINPSEHLSYQMPKPAFVVSEEDFEKTAMDYELYKLNISSKEFSEQLAQKVLYSSRLQENEGKVMISFKK